MSIAEILAAFQGLMSAITGITNILSAHEKKIADLEVKVLAHAAQLEHATLPNDGNVKI